MLKVCNVNPEAMMFLKAGETALVKGELVKFSSGTAIAAAAAHSGATILGVVAEDCAGGATAKIYNVAGKEIEADIYQGGDTDAFTDANIGALYDLIVASNDFKIDPNDTIGGFVVLSRYDSAQAKAWFRIPYTLLY